MIVETANELIDSGRVAPVDVVLAYVGPGAGLGAIGPLLAMIGVGVLMLVGFAWYPILKVREFFRGVSGKKEENLGD